MNEETRRLDAQTGWTPRQRNHLRRLMRGGAKIAYLCVDAFDRPANHEMDPEKHRAWTVRPGLVQEVEGPLELCSARALHATLVPHRWRGSRVWLVGLVGEVREDTNDQKLGALRREIIGLVRPECALSESVGIRIGRRDHLSGANLWGANLSCANLSCANLSRANLSGANLSRANLSGANLSGANLSGANLSRADLWGAYLSGADLSGANLSGANLSRAYLSGANLSGANLSSANLSGAYRPNAKEVSELVEAGWENDSGGYLRRKGT
jgi:hypothetical protein